MFRISAPSYMSNRLPLTTEMYSSTTFSEPRGPKLNLQSNLRFDDRTVRPTSRALCEMANARLAWSRKNWIGSRRCSSRQGGRGRGPRRAWAGAWRYCVRQAVPPGGVRGSGADKCRGLPSLAARWRRRAQNENRA